MQVDEYNNFSTLFIRYKQALKRLEDLGVSIPGASRLRKYESRLQQSLNDPRPALESKLVFALAFDLREIDEIIEIVDHLPYSPEVPLLNLLHQLPEAETNQTNHSLLHPEMPSMNFSLAPSFVA